ncbi:hypothetical protein [Plesiocystis pacifica]|uniref:hypothetical protein n=1 Tax=Plesiocystis pacifica TaxID=191768 RepID=UPI0012F915B1|nr:hypothetical protein [Plesiocystis pacifica]
MPRSSWLRAAVTRDTLCRSGTALRRAALACALAIGLAPSTARACKPFLSTYEHVPRPSWEPGAGLELVDEALDLDCERAGYRLTRCTWRARHSYAGQAGTPASGSMEFETSEAIASLRVAVNGVEVPTTIDGLRDRRGAAATVDEDGYILPDRVALSADDAGRVEVEVTLVLDLERYRGGHCTTPAGVARHPFASPHYTSIDFDLEPEHLRADPVETPIAPGASAEVQVRAPFVHFPRLRLRDHQSLRSRGRHHLRRRLPADSLRSVSVEHRRWSHGPVAAGGVGFGPQIRPRLRAGYELAGPYLTVASAAVEGDAIEELLVVPALEVASPDSPYFIPSVSLGVGAPVLVLPEPRPGVRALWSARWSILGLVGSVDIYPARGGEARTLRGALLLELTL